MVVDMQVRLDLSSLAVVRTCVVIMASVFMSMKFSGGKWVMFKNFVCKTSCFLAENHKI